MLLSLRKDGLDFFLKEVMVFKGSHMLLTRAPLYPKSSLWREGREFNRVHTKGVMQQPQRQSSSLTETFPECRYSHLPFRDGQVTDPLSTP